MTKTVTTDLELEQEMRRKRRAPLKVVVDAWCQATYRFHTNAGSYGRLAEYEQSLTTVLQEYRWSMADLQRTLNQIDAREPLTPTTYADWLANGNKFSPRAIALFDRYDRGDFDDHA